MYNIKNYNNNINMFKHKLHDKLRDVTNFIVWSFCIEMNVGKNGYIL